MHTPTDLPTDKNKSKKEGREEGSAHLETDIGGVEPGAVVSDSNPSTQETEMDLEFEASLGHIARPCYNPFLSEKKEKNWDVSQW